MLIQTLLEHLHDVMAFGVRGAEAFCPSNEDTVVYLLLSIMELIAVESLCDCRITYEHG